MIVVDTNAVSELMRPRPAQAVLAWFDAQPTAQLHVTTLTVAELLAGIALLARGKRRDALELAARQVIEHDFAGRCLAFDVAAAREYAAIVAGRSRAGAPISAIDAQIAAIVRSRDGVLATRNGRDFVGCGIDVVDPWS